MKKIMRISYEILALFMIFISVVAICCFRNQEYSSRTDYDYVILKEYKCQWVEDQSLPAGGKNVISLTMKDLQTEGDYLIFYVIHSNVKVYIGDQLVYSLEPDKSNVFGTTTSHAWVNFPLYESDNGKTIQIEITPAYKSGKETVPVFYVGDKWAVFRQQITENSMNFSLSILAIVVGLIFLTVSYHSYRKRSKDLKLQFLGAFSFLLGLWKILDMNSIDFYFPKLIGTSYLCLGALYLLLVPFALFLMENFNNRYEKIYRGICVVSEIYLTVVVVCQITDLADFKQFLGINHALLLILGVCGLLNVIMEVKRNGWTRKMNLAAFCITCCLIGLAIDIYVFYEFNGYRVSSFGMIGFLIYILVLGISKIRENVVLIEKGKSADRLEDMAYHDAMTGFYSRRAYTRDLVEKKSVMEGTAAIMCDLNNLKECNDSRGHDAGDRYLIQSAWIIKDSFEKSGDCYRLGGDEFFILIRNTNVQQVAELVKNMRTREAEFNTKHKAEYPIQIACGYALYDREADYDLRETVRRADRMMYEDKMRLKNLEV